MRKAEEKATFELPLMLFSVYFGGVNSQSALLDYSFVALIFLVSWALYGVLPLREEGLDPDFQLVYSSKMGWFTQMLWVRGKGATCQTISRPHHSEDFRGETCKKLRFRVPGIESLSEIR